MKTTSNEQVTDMRSAWQAQTGFVHIVLAGAEFTFHFAAQTSKTKKQVLQMYKKLEEYR